MLRTETPRWTSQMWLKFTWGRILQVLNYLWALVKQLNLFKAQRNKNHKRNSSLKEYFLFNFWRTMAGHLTSRHNGLTPCLQQACCAVSVGEMYKAMWFSIRFPGYQSGQQAVIPNWAGRWRPSRLISGSSLSEELAGIMVHQAPELYF